MNKVPPRKRVLRKSRKTIINVVNKHKQKAINLSIFDNKSVEFHLHILSNTSKIVKLAIRVKISKSPEWSIPSVIGRSSEASRVQDNSFCGGVSQMSRLFSKFLTLFANLKRSAR